MTTSIPSTLTKRSTSSTQINVINTQPVSSDNVILGRYVQGGKIENLGNRLGWWERTIYQPDPSDVAMELGMRYNMRPDLLAYDLYGKSTLNWFVLQYNYISDVTDFVAGLQIILPTKNRLFTQMLTITN